MPQQGDFFPVSINGREYKTLVYQMAEHEGLPLIKTQLRDKPDVKTVDGLIAWLELDGFVLYKRIDIPKEQQKVEEMKQTYEFVGR